MKDELAPRLTELQSDPVATIEHALSTITPELARSFIRHCGIYPAAWSSETWNGPGLV